MGLSNQIPSQDSPQAQKAAPLPNANTCAPAQHSYCVDLCSLAKILRSKPKTSIYLESLDHQTKMSMVQHEDLTLVVNHDQVIWTCNKLPKNQTFQITKITRVLRPPDRNADLPNSRPDNPFCSDTIYKPTHGGGQVPSGTPKAAAGGQPGQWYKYSFKVNDFQFDPHLIVTGGGGGPDPGELSRPGPRPYKCPSNPAPNPKQAK